MFALSPPSDHLWASHLALQTSAFLLLNAGREPKLADAPSGGGERSAPRTWELSPRRGAGAPERGAGAPSAGARRRRSSFPSTSRGPLSALPAPGRGKATPQPGAPRRWRRRTRRRREPGARGCRRRRGAGSLKRSSRPGRSDSSIRGDSAPGAPLLPFRKSTRPRRPARNAWGQRAGLLAQPRMPGTPSSRLSFPRRGELGRRVPRSVGEGEVGRKGSARGSRRASLAEPWPGCAPSLTRAPAGGRTLQSSPRPPGCGAVSARLPEAALQRRGRGARTPGSRRRAGPVWEAGSSRAHPHLGFVPGSSRAVRTRLPVAPLPGLGILRSFSSRPPRAAQVRGEGRVCEGPAEPGVGRTLCRAVASLSAALDPRRVAAPRCSGAARDAARGNGLLAWLLL